MLYILMVYVMKCDIDYFVIHNDEFRSTCICRIFTKNIIKCIIYIKLAYNITLLMRMEVVIWRV